MWPALIFFGSIVAVGLFVIAATSRHKKSSSNFHSLRGRQGAAFGDLTPEGMVIIDGEMWPAIVENGATVSDRQTICVTGARLTHILVEIQNPEVSE